MTSMHTSAANSYGMKGRVLDFIRLPTPDVAGRFRGRASALPHDDAGYAVRFVILQVCMYSTKC